MKKSFSLLELLIVVVIIAITYGFSVSSFNFSLKPKPKNSLKTLRSMLLKQSFREEVSFKCFDDDNECWIIVDGKVEQKVSNFFDSDNPPRSYNYSTNYNEITFKDYAVDEFDTKRVVFDLTLNKNGLKKELIVEYKEKVYIFNSLFEFPVMVEDISGVDEYFANKMSEIKSAF